MAPPRFSQDDACGIVGVPLPTLLSWRKNGAPACDERDERPFALSDLLALAVTREVASRVGPRLGDFAFGVKQLFQSLASTSDIERADELSAVVGHHLGLLRHIREEDRCRQEPGVVVVPLAPLLSELRNQVFP